MRNSTKIFIVLIVLANLLMLSSCSDNHEHIYEERRIIKNATCSIEGIYEYKCVKCDHIKQEAIPKKEHKVVVDEAVEATCANTGLTEGKHCEICKEKDIIVPNLYNDLPVTSIADGAFISQDITSIEIPSSVTNIGECAFENCRNLKEIKFGENSRLTNIKRGAFYICDKLMSINLPSSVVEIGEYAFAYCESLGSIVIPNSVEIIGKGAFQNCKSLKIYCEVEAKPVDWHSYWKDDSCMVVWGYSN